MSAERQDLVERDPGPRLDPQVLARHQPRPRATGSPRRHLRAGSGPGVGRDEESVPSDAKTVWARRQLPPRTIRPPATTDLAGGEGAAEVELVRGQQHGAALGGGGGDDLVEHLAAVGVETGVRLVEQEEPGLADEGDGEREPAALAGGEPAVRRRPATGRDRPARSRRRPPRRARRTARADEAEVLAHGQVVVAEGLVADERQMAGRAARAVLGEVVAEHLGRRPSAAGTRPATRRRSVVLPAPLAPERRTISPSATSRSTPARAGKRPRRQTAERSLDDERHATLRGRGRERDQRRECTEAPFDQRRTVTGPTGHMLRSPRCDGSSAGSGARSITARDPDPAVRRLPAVGHRDLRGPGPGRPREPSSQEAAGAAADHDDDADHDGAARGADHHDDARAAEAPPSPPRASR